MPRRCNFYHSLPPAYFCFIHIIIIAIILSQRSEVGTALATKASGKHSAWSVPGMQNHVDVPEHFTDVCSGVSGQPYCHVQEAAVDNGGVMTSLTLSEDLVQFLSALQLQGFASRVVEASGVQCVDDLTSLIRNEEDVEKLLGERSSLQQRQEFWKGLCRHKRLAAKRAREEVKKVSSRRTKSRSSVAYTENICKELTLSDKILPKTSCMFIEKLAFKGYDCNVEGAVSEVPGAADHFAEEVGSPPDSVKKDTGSPHLSTYPINSWSSPRGSQESLYLLSGVQPHVERLPLASLCVGLGELPAGCFDGEWTYLGCDDDTDREEEEGVPSRAVPQNSEVALDAGTFQQYKEEFEELKRTMRLSIEEAASTYNSRLTLLQSRIRDILENKLSGVGTADDSEAPPDVMDIIHVPKLRVELFPAGSQHFKTQRDAKLSDVSNETDETVLDNYCSHLTWIRPRSCDKLSAAQCAACNNENSSSRSSVGAITHHLGAPSRVTTAPSSAKVPGDDEAARFTQRSCPSIGGERHYDAVPEHVELASSGGGALGNGANDQSHDEVWWDSCDGCVPPPTANCAVAPLGVCEEFSGVLNTSETLRPAVRSTAQDNEGSVDQLEDAGAVMPGRAEKVESPSSMSHSLFLDNFGIQAIGHTGNIGNASFKQSAFTGFTMVGGECSQNAIQALVIDVDDASSSEGAPESQPGCNTFGQGMSDRIAGVTARSVSLERAETFDMCPGDSDNLVLEAGVYSEENFGDSCTQLMWDHRGDLFNATSRALDLDDRCEQQAVECPLDSGNHLTVPQHSSAEGGVQTHGYSINAPESLDNAGINELPPCGAYAADISPRSRDLLTPVAPVESSLQPQRSSGGAPNDGNANETCIVVDDLTPEVIMALDYPALCDLCRRLGLQLPVADALDSCFDRSYLSTNCEDTQQSDADSAIAGLCGENRTNWLMQGTTDSVCTLGGANGLPGDETLQHQQQSGRQHCTDHEMQMPLWEGGEEYGDISAVPLTQTVDVEDAEWCKSQKVIREGRMREMLRIFAARRFFMHDVVPFFFHRLPRFSRGPAYRPLKAADFLKSCAANSCAGPEEQRRYAKYKELEEITCCAISSLAGDAAEHIEKEAVSVMMNNTPRSGDQVADPVSTSVAGGSSVVKSAEQSKLSLYEQLLLMEPADVQAITNLVQSDFPHITRGRIETLVKESGVPISTSQRVYGTQRVINSELSATQRVASPLTQDISCRLVRTNRTESLQSRRKRFFADGGFTLGARGR